MTRTGNGGGGGGYFGGSTSRERNNYGGAGGSSYISGYPQCDAILESSTSISETFPSNQPIHYSNISFLQGKMIDGAHEMPVLNGVETGHEGHGFARIYKLTSKECTCNKFRTFSGYFYTILLICFIQK